MAHELEIVGDKVMMAYAGSVPWHGLGTRVPADLTPEQMLDAAGLNWTVKKVAGMAYDEDTDTMHELGRSALIRSSDNSMLDVVSDDWNPVQNQQAFEFFNDFVAAGDMEMHTAGSLKGGQIVWGLAKVKESFDLFKGDQIDSYLLFSNFHRYGFSTDVRFTPIRVVCNNTLTLSLSSAVDRMVKISHRKEFKPDSVKDMLGIASHKLAEYKEMAAFLGSKKAKEENIVEYFCRVFPVSGSDSVKEMSKNATKAHGVLHTQPGAEYAPGTWWSTFNAVTYTVDHLAGRSADSRLASSWYGVNKNVKVKALELAVEYANQ
jgi:phage/plasmid-like protein (TIGR03299 family)